MAGYSKNTLEGLQNYSPKELKEVAYNKAIELFNSKQYLLALLEFSELARLNYKDSKEKYKIAKEAINSTALIKALELYEKGKYEEVIRLLFNSPDDQAKQMRQKCREKMYEKAVIKANKNPVTSVIIQNGDITNSQLETCINENSLEKLIKLTTDIKTEFDNFRSYDYKESERYYKLANKALNALKTYEKKQNDVLKEVDYNEAIELYKEGSYEAAKGIFSKLGSFRDSKEWSSRCSEDLNMARDAYYNEAIALYKEGSYMDAKEMFLKLGTFKDSKELVNACAKEIDNLVLKNKQKEEQTELLNTQTAQPEERQAKTYRRVNLGAIIFFILALISIADCVLGFLFAYGIKEPGFNNWFGEGLLVAGGTIGFWFACYFIYATIKALRD